jgi:hypothetical protein
VLRLARNGAGVTANTLSEINGEPVIGHAGFGIYHARRDRPQSHRATEKCQERRTPLRGVVRRFDLQRESVDAIFH